MAMPTSSFLSPVVIRDDETAERLIKCLENPVKLDRPIEDIDAALERGRALLHRMSSHYKSSPAK